MIPFMTGIAVAVLLIAGVAISTAFINKSAGNYNDTFDAACRARGGEPTQLSRERVCFAPGVIR